MRVNTDFNMEDDVVALACYNDYAQHLFDELKLLKLKLMRELRIRHVNEKKHYKNSTSLFISDEEIISLLDSSHEVNTSSQNDLDILSLDHKIERMKAEIDTKLTSTVDGPNNFPILRLAGLFGLTPIELDVLIMSIAPEIHNSFARIYAYFNDDLTRRLPSLSLATDIIYRTTKEKLSGIHIFSHDSPLAAFDLIHFESYHQETYFLSQGFLIDERIRRFIFGHNAIDSRLSEFAQIYYPNGIVQNTILRDDMKKNIIKILLDEKRQNTTQSVFWLHGKAKDEKKQLATAISEEIGLPLLIADIEDIFFQPEPHTLLKTLFREAILQPALLFMDGGDRFHSKDEKSELFKRIFLKYINTFSWVTFISAESLWMPETTNERGQWYYFEFQLPEYEERKQIWARCLKGSKISESHIDEIAGRFNFTENQIRKATSYAKQFLEEKEFSINTIIDACTTQSGHRLSSFSRRIIPHYIWNDIVLPDDRLQQLNEICSYIKHKYIVYFHWGFEKRLALGRGLNILFSGPSGTGKTMAADIIASELHLDMYKIDLSSIVSKYIGETEKNLNRVFSETSSGNAILFFDEADALFGKRSEVKDAHDRYANIEINYLLQKMEEHEGIVILATNLSRNIDEAFLRRLHFNVEFPFPDEKMRYMIWKKVFPQKTPQSEDIDFVFLSEKIKLSGGNMTNIAVTSAFYAAEESSEIQMHHIIHAAKREYQKMGKTFIREDFAPYYKLMDIKD